MTIAAKLLTIDGIKTDIKAAIEAKGVDTTGAAFAEYDEKIALISSGNNLISLRVGTVFMYDLNTYDMSSTLSNVVIPGA